MTGGVGLHQTTPEVERSRDYSGVRARGYAKGDLRLDDTQAKKDASGLSGPAGREYDAPLGNKRISTKHAATQ